MTVAKVDYGYWHTLAGTLVEVADALKDNGVTPTMIITCELIATDSWVAIYRQG